MSISKLIRRLREVRAGKIVENLKALGAEVTHYEHDVEVKTGEDWVTPCILRKIEEEKRKPESPLERVFGVECVYRNIDYFTKYALDTKIKYMMSIYSDIRKGKKALNMIDQLINLLDKLKVPFLAQSAYLPTFTLVYVYILRPARK